MNGAQRKALQAFWNTFGIVLAVAVACLVYLGMLWLGSEIANAAADTYGWRLIVFIAVMGLQIGLVVGLIRAWITYRKEARP